MKNKSRALAAASVAAAAASASAAYSSPSCSILFSNSRSQESVERPVSSENSTASSEKFAPRFDGLRFIETLVTAHR